MLINLCKMESIDTSVEKRYPSEAHITLMYKAYKAEIQKKFPDRSSENATLNVDAILAQKRSRHAVMWEEVCEETEKRNQETQKLQADFSETAIQKVTAREYLDENVFPVLLPILEETLRKAEENDCLKVQKCRFNGIDYIVERLWNRNPQHPERAKDWKTVFEIPFVREWLSKNPRPIYPKSWLWSREEAAIIIQSAVRGFLVRKSPEVQEMRQFWKALEAEQKAALQKKQEEHQKALMIIQQLHMNT